jgi:pSer/pThr/pTyr-binding forkhead associated (FHA) protein
MNGKHPSLDTVPVGRDCAEPGGHALLLVNDLGLRAVPLPASGAVVVGRGSGAEIRVADAGMSRRHVRIHLEPPFRAEDLGSANGTVLGGRQLAPGELRAFAAGDAIVAGTTTMLLRPRARAPADPAERPEPELIVSDALRPSSARPRTSGTRTSYGSTSCSRTAIGCSSRWT